jgi:hypothetical protein
MAHLLYFLNPQIDIGPLRLLGVSAIYGMIAGILFGTALWLIHRARARLIGGTHVDATQQPRALGFVSAGAMAAAVVYWGHVLLLRVYLPRGAVRILSKASTIVAGAAVALLLFWLIRRLMPGTPRRFLSLAAWVLVIASIVLLHIRHEQYRSDAHPVTPVVFPEKVTRPVIVVSVPGLPFDWVLQLIGEDQMPFLSRARDESFLARVEPFPTTSPKSLWASLATGKLPHAHGVTGRFSYRTLLNRNEGEAFRLVPYWVGFKAWGLIPPVERISAQLPSGDVLPLWSDFERHKVPAAVINWPEADSGSASYVAPEAEVEREARRLNLSDDAAAAAMARSALINGPLTVVSLNDLADLQSRLRLRGNRLPAPTTTGGEAVRAWAERLDELLKAIGDAAPEATLIVVSSSGVNAPVLPATPLLLVQGWINREEPGSADGFLLVRGPHAMHREHPAVLAVTDIVPTTLFAAGLPVGRDMDGRVVAEAFNESFAQQNPIAMVPSYEAGPR